MFQRTNVSNMQVCTREGEGEEGEGMVNMIRTNEV